MIIVAALSLIVVGGGLFVKNCRRPERMIEPAEVEVILQRDSVAEARADSVVKARRDSLHNFGHDYSDSSVEGKRTGGKSTDKRATRNSRSKKEVKKRKETPRKTYRRRSPLDEPINSDY